MAPFYLLYFQEGEHECSIILTIFLLTFLVSLSDSSVRGSPFYFSGQSLYLTSRTIQLVQSSVLV